MMAGYSKTPLLQKLGVKPGHRVALVNAPRGMKTLLGIATTDLEDEHDVILVFATTKKSLSADFARAKKRLHQAGGLWVAWPKKASGVKTDVTEDVVRAIALDAGLVDNKVCAIDEIWSGLRCVVRVRDRK